jgi:hypothetical protein
MRREIETQFSLEVMIQPLLMGVNNLAKETGNFTDVARRLIPYLTSYSIANQISCP